MQTVVAFAFAAASVSAQMNGKDWSLAELKERYLQHKRPSFGKGHLMLSSDDGVERYDDKRMMVAFDMECMKESSETVHTGVETILESFPCLSGENKKVFETPDRSLAFVDIEHEQCFDKFVFDWDKHCVDYFSYLPGIVVKQSILTESDYTCMMQNLTGAYNGTLWGLDWISGNDTSDDLYYFPNMTKDNGVDVYIVDAGVRDTHVVFQDNLVIHEMGAGPQNTPGYNDTTWWQSHGTHVAGTVAGDEVGVTRGLTIYDYRVCVFSADPTSQYDGFCPFDLILTAFEMIGTRLMGPNAGRRGSINFSVGGGASAESTLYNYYFDRINNAGGIISVAAGNEGANACDFAPSFSNRVITVGALYGPYPTYFSNWGSCVDVWAPGLQIRSSVATCDTCFEAWAGTSMASPHVAGMVATILYKNPTLGLQEVLAALRVNNRYDGYNLTTMFADNETSCEPNCYAPFVYDCEVPATFSTTPFVQYTSQIPSKTHDGERQDECNYVIVHEYDQDNGTVLSFEYRAAGVCYSEAFTYLNHTTQGNRDDWSFAYKCIDDNTAAIYKYDNFNCSGGETVHYEIYDGFYDGLYLYSVNCQNNNNDVTEECLLELGVDFSDVEPYCDGSDLVCPQSDQPGWLHLKYPYVIGVCEYLGNFGGIYYWSEWSCNEVDASRTYYVSLDFPTLPETGCNSGYYYFSNCESFCGRYDNTTFVSVNVKQCGSPTPELCNSTCTTGAPTVSWAPTMSPTVTFNPTMGPTATYSPSTGPTMTRSPSMTPSMMPSAMPVPDVGADDDDDDGPGSSAYHVTTAFALFAILLNYFLA